MTPRGSRSACVGVLSIALLLACIRDVSDESWLRQPQTVAQGVELYRTSDPSLVDGAGPIAVSLLRLDPGRVRLVSVLSNDQVADAERVLSCAQRLRGVAA